CALVISLASRLSCFLFFFFFSSRRRHTRSKRDWSSDVCSSDLLSAHVPEIDGVLGEVLLTPTRIYAKDCMALTEAVDVHAYAHRSEERRVGKECRSRGSP